MVGLKPTHGGSTPPFLVSLIELEQTQVLQMYDRGVGSREVTQRLLWLILQLKLPVLQQMPLK